MNLFQQNIYRMRKEEEVVGVTGPTAPSNLQLVSFTEVSGSWEVSLDWDAATDDVGVSYYEIHQSYNNGNYVVSETTSLTNITYVLGSNPSGTFRWKVLAYDTDGNVSPFSNIVYYFNELTLNPIENFYIEDVWFNAELTRQLFELKWTNMDNPHAHVISVSYEDGPYESISTQIVSTTSYSLQFKEENTSRFGGKHKFRIVPKDTYGNEGPPVYYTYISPTFTTDLYLQSNQNEVWDTNPWDMRFNYIPVDGMVRNFIEYSFNNGSFTNVMTTVANSAVSLTNFDINYPRYKGTHTFKRIARDGTNPATSNVLFESTLVWENVEGELPPS